MNKIERIAIETGEVDVHNTMLVVMESLGNIISNNSEFPTSDKTIIADTINLLLNSIGFGMMRFDMIREYDDNNIDSAYANKIQFHNDLNIDAECVKFNDEIHESGNSETFVLDLTTNSIKSI